MIKCLLLIPIFFLSVIDSCSRISREAFTIERDTLGTKSFSTQGLYYYKNIETDQVKYIIFYQDGIVYGPFTSNRNINEIIKNINNPLYSGKDLVYSWGIYNVKNSILTIETWTSSDGGPYPTVIREAEIINDTTFVVTKSMYSDGYKKEKHSEIYHFKYLSTKPDSTNPYIK